MNMTLGRILRSARQAKGVSQLALSLTLEVSQRHVSYLESDRARASRELILAWMKAVDAPTEVRNAALHHSGFSCESKWVTPSRDTSLDGHQAELFKSTAISFPILLFNANWQLLEVNPAAEWLAIETMPVFWSGFTKGTAGMSMIDALVDPGGLLLHMANAKEVGAQFLTQIEQESWTNQGLAAGVEKLSESLAQHYGISSTDDGYGQNSSAALKMVFDTQHGALTFFPVQSTLGHTQGITLQSLRIAHWFPGDDHTKGVLRTHAQTLPTAVHSE